MSTKRSTNLEILAQLNVKIFAQENFTEFNFAIHNPTHRKFLW